jgi:hypothetical protein
VISVHKYWIIELPMYGKVLSTWIVLMNRNSVFISVTFILLLQMTLAIKTCILETTYVSDSDINKWKNKVWILSTLLKYYSHRKKSSALIYTYFIFADRFHLWLSYTHTKYSEEFRLWLDNSCHPTFLLKLNG